MAYVQRFGLSRKSPLALVPKKVVNDAKEANKRVVPEVQKSSTPSHDVIKKNVEKEPSESKGWWDWVSDGLTVAGMVPGLGIIPDAINTAGNLVASGHAALTGGDTSKYLANAALAGGAMIPGIGQGISGTKLASKVLPGTVKGIQALDKGSKIVKGGKILKKAKTAKGAGILAAHSGLLGSANYDDHKDKIIPAGYVVNPNAAP